MQPSNLDQKERPKSRARHAGFGLLELVVVVAIVGILAAIAIPEYGAFVERARNLQGHLIMNGLQKQQFAFLAFYDRFGSLDELGGWGDITTASADIPGGDDSEADDGGLLGDDAAHFAGTAPGAGAAGGATGTGGHLPPPTPPPNPSATPDPSATPAPPEPPSSSFNCNDILRAQNIETTALAFVAGASGESFGQFEIQSTNVPGSKFCLVQWFLSSDKRNIASFAVQPVKPNSSFYTPDTIFFYFGALASIEGAKEPITFAGTWPVAPGFFGNI